MKTTIHIDIEDSSPAMLTSSSSSSSSEEYKEEESPQILPIPSRKRFRRKASYDIDSFGTFRAKGLMITPGEIPMETLIDLKKKQKHSTKEDTDVSLTSSTQSSYVILGTLGSGASAAVYSAIHIHSMRVVALKKISLYDSKTRHQMLSELQHLRFNQISCDMLQRRRCFDCGAFAGCCDRSLSALGRQSSSSSTDSTDKYKNSSNNKRKSSIMSHFTKRLSIELTKGSTHTRRHCSACEAVFCGNCKKNHMRSVGRGYHCWICFDCEESSKLPFAFIPSGCMNILKLHDVFVNPDEGLVSIVTELMDAGSLQSMIDTKQRFTSSFLAIIADAVLRALVYLHSLKLIHRDIKPANILFNSFGQVKLSDFGLTVQAREEFIIRNSSESPQDHAGTTAYMCPRRISGRNATMSSDVWALGATILACALQRSPFDANDFFTMYAKICDDEIPKPPDDEIRTGHSGVYLCDFIDQCLIRNERDRPSAKHLLTHHPFPLSLQQHSKSESNESNKSTRHHNANAYRHKALAEWISMRNNVTNQRNSLKHSEGTKSIMFNALRLLQKRAYLGIPSPKNVLKHAKVGTEAWFENGRMHIAAAAAKAVLSYHSERIAVALRYQMNCEFSPRCENENLENEKEEGDIIMMSFLRVCYEIETGKLAWISRWVELFSSGCIRLYRVSGENKTTPEEEGLCVDDFNERVKICTRFYQCRENKISVKRVGNKARSNSLTNIVSKINSIRVEKTSPSSSSSSSSDKSSIPTPKSETIRGFTSSHIDLASKITDDSYLHTQLSSMGRPECLNESEYAPHEDKELNGKEETARERSKTSALRLFDTFTSTESSSSDTKRKFSFDFKSTSSCHAPENGFRIIANGRTVFLFDADSERTRDRWIIALKAVSRGRNVKNHTIDPEKLLPRFSEMNSMGIAEQLRLSMSDVRSQLDMEYKNALSKLRDVLFQLLFVETKSKNRPDLIIRHSEDEISTTWKGPLGLHTWRVRPRPCSLYADRLCYKDKNDGDVTVQLRDLREVRMVEGFKNRFRIFFHDSKRQCIEMSSQSADVCVMWMDLIEKQRLRMNDMN